MGSQGEDVPLSPAARFLFPFSVECKSLNRIRVYEFYKQCQANTPPKSAIPLVVIKQNQDQPLAILSLDDLFKIMEMIWED